MHDNHKVEMRITRVPYVLKRELYAMVEQKQKALGNKKYTLSDLVIEILESYVSESYEEKIEKEKTTEHQQFLQDVAKEVAKVGTLEEKLNHLIRSVNANTTTLQELLNEM